MIEPEWPDERLWLALAWVLLGLAVFLCLVPR